MLTKSIAKKVSSFRIIGKWVFWNPCFTTDCRDTYIYSGIDALPVNCMLHSGVCRFVPIEDTAISDHRS